MQSAASQHNDCFGLACFHLRDSCVLVRVCCARAHGVDFKKSPGPGRTTRPGPGFCIVWDTVNKQEADRMEWSFVFFLNSALLGVGLAMDAFAVSICGSLALAPASRFSGALRFGIWFGFFQALMPVVGFFCAIRFRSYIETYDHWIAFILLIYLGINMLSEADAADSCNLKQHYNIREMLTLAVATSIDALAVGVSFAFLDVDIWTAAGLIGLVTFIFSMVGGLAGFRLGERIGSRATLVGGCVLIIIGTKILLEHTGWL